MDNSFESLYEPLMTIKEAAHLLHVHDNTLRRWSKRGMVRAYRVNSRGDRRFRKADIDQFLAEYNSTTSKSI